MYVSINYPESMCILPFCYCPYKREKANTLIMCDDIKVSPGNSDAGCYKVRWKKQMAQRSSVGIVQFPDIDEVTLG